MLTVAEIRVFLNSVRGTYGRGPSGTDAEVAWIEALGKNADSEVLHRAWSRYRREAEKPPVPAQILRLMRDVSAERAAGAEVTRVPCVPCERENGVRSPATDALYPPQVSVIGPQDRHGPNEPLCSWHLEREALRSHRERAERGELRIDGVVRECKGHSEPRAHRPTRDGAAFVQAVLAWDPKQKPNPKRGITKRMAEILQRPHPPALEDASA